MASRREIEGEFGMGWAGRKRPSPHVLKDGQGRVISVQTPYADLQGLITPTDLRYVKAQLDTPEPVHPDDWSLSISGGVDGGLTLSLEDLQGFPAATVRCVTECSGSDSDFFDYLKSRGKSHGCYRCRQQEGKPSRYDPELEHNGLVSSGEWTGVPLAAVLERAGLKPEAAGILVQGFDRGRPAEWAVQGAEEIPEGEISFEKCLPIKRPLTLTLCWRGP